MNHPPPDPTRLPLLLAVPDTPTTVPVGPGETFGHPGASAAATTGGGAPPSGPCTSAPCRCGWLEAHPDVAQQWREVTRELAWQQRARQAGVEAQRPAWQERTLGPLPGTVRGRRAWRQTAAQLADYRDRYGIRDPEQALGPEPKGGDLEQRQAWRACRMAAERLRACAEPARLPDRQQPTRTALSSLPQRGAERAAG